MADNWNKAGFFFWHNGRLFKITIGTKEKKENPYKMILFTLWQLLFGSMRRSFIIPTWMLATQKKPLDEAYKEWKEQLLSEHLPSKSPNPEGDTTNWEKSFETGKREV